MRALKYAIKNMSERDFEIQSIYYNEVEAIGCVLARTPHDRIGQPYAVWTLNSDGHTFSGGYYKHLVDAVGDFQERVSRYS